MLMEKINDNNPGTFYSYSIAVEASQWGAININCAVIVPDNCGSAAGMNCSTLVHCQK